MSGVTTKSKLAASATTGRSGAKKNEQKMLPMDRLSRSFKVNPLENITPTMRKRVRMGMRMRMRLGLTLGQST